MAQQEGVLDDHRLLLDAVAGERLAGVDRVIVAAKGMALEGQEDAALVLPDMDELVDQQALEVEIRGGEILAIAAALGVEMDMAEGRHGDVARLEERPFAIVDADLGGGSASTATS